MGFLLFGGLGLISGLPIIFFPKKMRRNKAVEEIKDKQKRDAQGKNRLAHDTKGSFFVIIVELILIS